MDGKKLWLQMKAAYIVFMVMMLINSSVNDKYGEIMLSGATPVAGVDSGGVRFYTACYGNCG